MLLNDIGNNKITRLSRINHHLASNYGFKISEDTNYLDFTTMMETIQGEIYDLKMKGEDAKTSAEISKRLLILEGIKTLREYASTELKSPDLDTVIKQYSEMVADHFKKKGTSTADFDRSVDFAMDEYRKSEYLFSDSYIETAIRAPALEKILMALQKEPSDSMSNEFPVMEQTKSLKYKKGSAMKESLVKRLRMLLETEVSQAEVMMAAKEFAGELQEMVEKVGRLQNEDLPPVTDQMRETYGMESASAFQTQIYSAFQGVMDSLYTAKDKVDAAVSNMASTGQVSAQTDMDANFDMDGRLPSNTVTDTGQDLDNVENMPSNQLSGEEDFGGEMDEPEIEEPLGREMKTEAVLKRKIAEMQKLVHKARKLRETANK